MTLAPGIEQLRQELTRRRWSAQDLADQIQRWAYHNDEGTLGITRSYVSQWLNGRRGVSAPYAHRLEAVVGIPADQFVDRRSARARKLEEMQRRDFLRATGTAAATALVTLPDAGLGSKLANLLPDQGIDWNLPLPGGQSFGGASIAAQFQSVTAVERGKALLKVDNPARLNRFLQLSQRGLVLATEETGDRVRYFGLDARQARRQLRKRSARYPVLSVPLALELDDFTFGVLWALANLDDALSADDQVLDEEMRELRAYEQLPSSAVSREAVADLTTVSQMWLGSNFCARHILRTLDDVPESPVFWTREQRGEEASTWLLFGHKYDYLRATSARYSSDGVPLVRGFCVPEAAVRSSARYERTMLFLAVALMESLGIETRICVEPEYSDVEGFVLTPAREAVIANYRGSRITATRPPGPPSQVAHRFRIVAGVALNGELL